MKCPRCNSKVDYKSFTTDSKGNEYYACPACEAKLVHQMSFGKVLLMSMFGLPILYFFIDLLLALFVVPLTSSATILGFDLFSAASMAASIIIVIWFITYSIRLIDK